MTFLNSFLFGGKFEVDFLKSLKFSSEHNGLLGNLLKFKEEENKNGQELNKLKNDYEIQKEALKLQAPNEKEPIHEEKD